MSVQQQVMQPKITFFMLVTDPDVMIADYAVRSYRKIRDTYGDLLPFVLYIYANCLSNANKKKYFPRWHRFSYVYIYDNEEIAKTMDLTPGKVIYSGDGGRKTIHGPWETSDGIWTRELRKLTTQYHATVDADFEILDPHFVKEIISTLDADRSLIGMSTDHTDTVNNYFDTYSQERITLKERWHTWFCVYRKEACVCTTSHFFYESISADGIRNVYDCCGRFQHHLIEKHGYRFASLPQKFQSQFIHYTAFSKNLSVNGKNVWLYRLLSIWFQNGIVVSTPFTLINKSIAKLTRKIARRLFERWFGMYTKERQNIHIDKYAHIQKKQ
jgi:hypothetical protein